MDTGLATTSITGDQPSRRQAWNTELYGRRLVLARVAYGTLILLLLAPFVAGFAAQPSDSARGTVLDIILLLGFCIPALIIFSRKSSDAIAMFVSLTLVAVGAAKAEDALAFVASLPQWSVTVPLISFVFKSSTLLLFCIFPDGRFIPHWTRGLAGAAIVWAALLLLPPPLNPWTWPFALGNAIDLSLYAAGLYAQTWRYRRVSSLQERQQSKWLLFGMGVALVGVYTYELPPVLLPSLQGSTVAALRYQDVAQPLSYLALLAVPFTFALSILRYRLWDIDLVINRTLVYVPLSAILAGLYSASVTVAENLYIELAGSKSDAPTVFTTLVVVSAFTPIKTALQNLVDKYFGQVSDPRKKMQAFAEQTQSRLFPVEAQEITRRLLEETIAAFGAKSGAVYLRVNEELRLSCITREWKADPVLQVPLAGDDPTAPLGHIALGPRSNGADYTVRDREILQQTAQVVALAIEQDRRVG